jgi:hypothetical protein
MGRGFEGRPLRRSKPGSNGFVLTLDAHRAAASQLRLKSDWWYLPDRLGVPPVASGSGRSARAGSLRCETPSLWLSKVLNPDSQDELNVT